MLNILKDFLLNLFFILAPIFAVPLWLEERKVPKLLKNHVLTVSFALTTFLCMTFPISTDTERDYNLHQIPLWLGSLYKGPLVGFILCLLAIGYHILLGKEQWMITVMPSFFVMFVSMLLSKYFLSLSVKQRILLTFVLSTFSGMLTVLLDQMAFSSLPFWSSYLIIQPISMATACYLKEMLYKNNSLRKQIIRAEKMEVVSHLAASISHEVRNPLTAARGFMQLLEQSHLPPEKRKQYIQIAIEELDRAESIITDYLTFAKPAPEYVEKLNVKTEIERVIDLLRPLANMNSVDIQASLIPFHVKGEREKFQQCLLNIMKNSIEAMQNGGTLDIYVSIEHEQILIRVSDTGIGMTKEQIDRLGEPYFTTKGTKGTGLGMMVVYRIVESMDGTIHITSEVNKGTTVCIYFPLAQSRQKQTASDQENALVI
ncbi:ATP-binding protein [Anoxybacillus rupiensis]|uniref:histidine kinase n=2 Tax=Anoxybacteroides rupiense TaxID=311460 RepID=A0ABD5IVX8_9BACL|nr:MULTISPECIES: ATP-binding protein [Anoxybacillus]KXG09205.1 Sporulation kinase E [Anoxybacillus sp. P3H1B]MBB3905829.1 two-component system sporulation sensor kinase B [Anoxybacillus rupiensis]MBS2772415.1 sensor histidine kinase [Anoxybacillus rupiensis]MDE8564031.1 ATP-binding protein [Anoxybacillus rupiensis]MED5051576.1 ATP-binding protein [Anoxybacillus rupiensis]